MKRKIYLDMDNTLAVFSISKEQEPQALERMYEKGFFRNLPTLKNPRPHVEWLQRQGYEVYILTKCIDSAYCIIEKWQWLQEHLPTIPIENFIPVPANGKKTDYVTPRGNFLVDDYKANLREWENLGGIPVKFSSNPNKIHPWLTIYSLEGLVNYLKSKTGKW